MHREREKGVEQVAKTCKTSITFEEQHRGPLNSNIINTETTSRGIDIVHEVEHDYFISVNAAKVVPLQEYDI